MFYTFAQNNSGGSFVIAESIGIYFDGVECDLDCECCGDRWSRYCDENDEPLINGQAISELKKKSVLCEFCHLYPLQEW